MTDPPLGRSHVKADPRLVTTRPTSIVHSLTVVPRAFVTGDPHCQYLALRSPITMAELGGRPRTSRPTSSNSHLRSTRLLFGEQ